MRDNDMRARRLAAIKLIVDQLEDLGKTKLQKILYFTQEEIGAPLGYRFRMHHYGPFSEAVDHDISFMRAIGQLEIQPDESGFGFHIRPASDDVLELDEEVNKFKSAMTTAIDKLGKLETPDLELWATTHFVQRLVKEPTRNTVIENVSRLKPRFTPEKIETAYDQHG